MQECGADLDGHGSGGQEAAGVVGRHDAAATDDRGRTFVVEAMVSNPDEPLAEESIVDLVHLAEDAFALLS